VEEREDSSQPADEEVAEGALDSLYDLEEGVEREPDHLRMRLKELLERIIEKKVEAYMADSIAPPEEEKGPPPE
jgi:hypothetical protein